MQIQAAVRPHDPIPARIRETVAAQLEQAREAFTALTKFPVSVDASLTGVLNINNKPGGLASIAADLTPFEQVVSLLVGVAQLQNLNVGGNIRPTPLAPVLQLRPKKP